MQRKRDFVLLLILVCIAAAPLVLLLLLTLPSDAFAGVDPAGLSPRLQRALQNRQLLVLAAAAVLAAATLLGFVLGGRRLLLSLYAGMLVLAEIFQGMDRRNDATPQSR